MRVESGQQHVVASHKRTQLEAGQQGWLMRVLEHKHCVSCKLRSSIILQAGVQFHPLQQHIYQPRFSNRQFPTCTS